MAKQQQYLVEGTIEANVHTIVTASTPNAARNKAEKEGSWWFNDSQSGMPIAQKVSVFKKVNGKQK